MVEVLQGAQVKVYRTVHRCTCKDQGATHPGTPCPQAKIEVLEKAPEAKEG